MGRTRGEFSMGARFKWPGHPDPDGPAFSCLRFLCRSLCHTILNKICSAPIWTLTPGLPRFSQGIVTRGSKAVKILLSIIGAKRPGWKAKFSLQGAWAQICGLAASLPGSIQDYASPGPAMSSIFFEFISKSGVTARSGQGCCQAP